MSDATLSAGRQRSALQRYGVAVLSVILAVAISDPLERLVVADPLQRLYVAGPLYYAAVVVSAWLGGLGPGLLAVGLATVAVNYFLMMPIYVFTPGLDDIPRLAAFALSALLVAWLSARRRRLEQALRRSRDELEVRVQERTSDLQRTNEQLETEIAERQQAAAALRDSERRFRYIFETAGVSIWEEDFSEVEAAIENLRTQGIRDFRAYIAAHPEFVRKAMSLVKVVDVNDASLTLFGARSKEELRGAFHRIFTPESEAELAGELIAIAEGRASLASEAALQTLKGERLVVLFTMTLPPRPARLDRVLVTVQDITQRKRAEEAVRRQADLLEQTHDAILVWEFPRTIVYWNRGAERLYGFSREEAVGRRSHELLQTEFPTPTPLFEATLERDGHWTGHLTHTTRDGRKTTVESRQVLMREADGRRLVLETNRDITERQQAEAALQNAQAELAHITRVTTMAEMAASIAHEINQPLGAIVSNGAACLRWLSGDPPHLDAGRESAKLIVRDGHRASEVIARIRTLLRKAVPEKTRLEVNVVIAEVIALAHPEVIRHRVSVRTALTDSLPPVLGDRIQLQQVLLNLIMNGIEATGTVTDRPRELVVRTEESEVGGVLVAVQDSGIGLDPQTTDRLFDAFFTTKPAGLGMGLSISRSIIEAHGGRLWATPNADRGATFQFSLPPVGEREA